MSVTKTSSKLKKVSISLSTREADLLQFYATQKGITKGVAAKRLLKEGLRQYASVMDKNSVPQNQLDLFDAVQTDIFCIDGIE